VDYFKSVPTKKTEDKDKRKIAKAAPSGAKRGCKVGSRNKFGTAPITAFESRKQKTSPKSGKKY